MTGWFLAELIMEITVEDDSRNVIHQNLTLIEAPSPEKALEKALRLGHDAETTYSNPQGKTVSIKFRGISDLDELYEEPEDGAEIGFRYKVGVSEEQLKSMIPPRHLLRAFRPPKRAEGPDYASAEVVAEVERRYGVKRPARDNK